MDTAVALVTGANGFVGCHVVRALAARGSHVRAFVRQTADRRALEGIDCEVVFGDLREPEAVERAVRGCDEVYHVAADYRLWLIDEAPMYAVNVQGTLTVINAALAAGVRRIVHTSTVGALGIGADGLGREDTPVTLGYGGGV